MKRRFIALAVLLTAALAPCAPAFARQSKPNAVQTFILDRCPGLRVASQDLTEDAPTASGFMNTLTYSAGERTCAASLQADVPASLEAVQNALRRSNWTSVSDDVWRLGDDLLVIQKWSEDGIPGAVIARLPADSPAGSQVLTAVSHARRGLAEATTVAVFDLCPIFLGDDEDAQRRAARSEREMLTGGPAADPADGRIMLQPGKPFCEVSLAGARAEAAVVATYRNAEARGYARDDKGFYRGETYILWANTADGDDATRMFQLMVMTTAAFDALRPTSPTH